MSFNREQLTAACIAALKNTKPQALITDLVRQAISEPASIFIELGEPDV